MERIKFINNDLTNDIEKIESFDVPITVKKDYDSNLDYPYILDVEDNSYFYANESDQNNDFDLLKSSMPKFSFVEL